MGLKIVVDMFGMLVLFNLFYTFNSFYIEWETGEKIKFLNAISIKNKNSINKIQILQRRLNSDISFNRTFEEYENGFGDINGNHWIG